MSVDVLVIAAWAAGAAGFLAWYLGRSRRRLVEIVVEEADAEDVPYAATALIAAVVLAVLVLLWPLTLPAAVLHARRRG